MDSWRQETQWLRGDSVLLCEANVPPSEIGTFVGSRPDGPSDRAQMMFDFLLNPRALAGAGSKRRGAAHRSPDHGGAAARRRAVGQLPAQPR